MSDTSTPTLEIPAVDPPTYPIPPAYPGAWYGSYSVTTAEGVDTYVGVATDGSGFHVTAPSGTPVWKVLGGPAGPATTISALDFIRRWMPAEQVALMAANPLWGILIVAAKEIDVTDPVVIADVQDAVTKNVVTQARADQVLNLSVASP